MVDLNFQFDWCSANGTVELSFKPMELIDVLFQWQKKKKSLKEWSRKMMETNDWFSRWEYVVDSLETVEEVFKGFDPKLESWAIKWDCAFVPRAFDDWERFDRFWTTLGVMLIVVWEMTPVDIDCWVRSF